MNKCKCGFRTKSPYCPNCGSWVPRKPVNKANDVFNRLIQKARQGHLELADDGFTDNVFEASLKITGKAKLLKIPADLGLVNDECKKDILEFRTGIQASKAEDDYFELSICYDDGNTKGEPIYQINMLANTIDFYPIMINKDQTIDIIKIFVNMRIV